jgi:hypothetical protein
MSRKTALQGEKSLPPMDPAQFDREAVFRAISYVPDDWQRLFHQSRARSRVLACGVRVGKTFCLASEATAAALCPSSKSLELNEWVGSRGWIVGPTYDIANKLFVQVLRYLRRHFRMFITGVSERERIIKLLGGGYVQAKSAENPDSLTSEELDWAIIDEAPRVSEEAKENVRERLLTRHGWLACIGSPVPCRWFQRDFALGQGAGYAYEWDGQPIDKSVRYAGRSVRFVKAVGDPDPDYFSMTVPTHANRRLDPKELADIERTSPERVFRQDFLAEFMSKDGTVFSNFERLATAEHIPQGLPDRRYIIGWDVARAKDYSVVSILDYSTREQVFFDRFQGPWSLQKSRVARICRAFNRPDLIIDATGKGDVLVEDMKVLNAEAAVRAANPRPGHPEDLEGPFAARIEGIEFYNNSVKRDVVENLVVGLDQGLIRLLDEPIQLLELRLYEYKQSDATGIVRYGAPPGYHDDTVMALAIAWWRCSRPMGTASILMS